MRKTISGAIKKRAFTHPLRHFGVLLNVEKKEKDSFSINIVTHNLLKEHS